MSRYQVRDKRGTTRRVYNAKINIHRQQDRPIFLGIQHRELHPPGGARPAWPEAELSTRGPAAGDEGA